MFSGAFFSFYENTPAGKSEGAAVPGMLHATLPSTSLEGVRDQRRGWRVGLVDPTGSADPSSLRVDITYEFLLQGPHPTALYARTRNTYAQPGCRCRTVYLRRSSPRPPCLSSNRP